MLRCEEEIVVNNKYGLHTRPAAIFVQLANKFDSKVILEKDNKAVDGKSIIAILTLGVNCGMKVKLIIEGVDAEEAFCELKNFLQKSDD